jgi:hypothetical protein
LRLHCHQFTATAQLATIGVQDVIIEVEFHVRYRTFLKKQSSPPHEEIKRQAKSWGHSPCILPNWGLQSHCLQRSQFHDGNPSHQPGDAG